MLRALGTALVDMVFPPRCIACAEPTSAPHGLCPACWAETHFIAGAACRRCGLPLVGESGDAPTAEAPEGASDGWDEDVCDACRRHPPAWDRGAAATLYDGAVRRVILGLKHGDRLDTVRPLAAWMAAAGRGLIAGADVIAPTPLHWRRLAKRRYNQSAELAKRLGALTGKPVAVDLLARRRFTRPQEGMDRAARIANQAGAFAVAPRRLREVRGRAVLLVDDVLTTGATLSACADALRAAGAARVDVLALARVAFRDHAPL